MQTIHVFNAFDESLDLTPTELEQWAVEMFHLMQSEESTKAELFKSLNLSDEDVPRFLMLAGIYHFLGMHADDCSMRHAMEVINNGRGVSPLVATVRETQEGGDDTVSPEEKYFFEPSGTAEEFIEHLYNIAPPEVKADWNKPRNKRNFEMIRAKFEKRRRDVVMAFEVVHDHGTSFEQAIQWQEIEIEDIKRPDARDFLTDMLDDLFSGL